MKRLEILLQAARLCGFDPKIGWPESLQIRSIAYLQIWQDDVDAKQRRRKIGDFHSLLEFERENGNIEHTTTTVQIDKSYYCVDPSDRLFVTETRHHVTAEAFSKWMARQEGFTPSPMICAWLESQGVAFKPIAHNPKTDRHERRYQMCIDAGLVMPDNDYGKLPNGIKELAKKEGISTAAFSQSVKTHLAKRRL